MVRPATIAKTRMPHRCLSLKLQQQELDSPSIQLRLRILKGNPQKKKPPESPQSMVVTSPGTRRRPRHNGSSSELSSLSSPAALVLANKGLALWRRPQGLGRSV